MTESIYEFVLARLAASKGRWPEVAEVSGVPYRSIEKIANRKWPNPGIQSIEKLATYFRALEELQELN